MSDAEVRVGSKVWVAFSFCGVWYSVPGKVEHITKAFGGDAYAHVQSLPYALPGSTKEYTYWIGTIPILISRLQVEVDP